MLMATATAVSSEPKSPTGLLVPDENQFTVESARFVLSLTFTQETQDRVRELLEKNQEEPLTSAEKEELEGILNANTSMGTLQAKARRFLKGAGRA
jgi:hypothetical protein